MNEDILKGKWHQVKGAVKAQWGRLTNDDLDTIAGEREKLVGRIQELYGESKENVAKTLDRLIKAQEQDAGGCCDATAPAGKTEKAKGY